MTQLPLPGWTAKSYLRKVRAVSFQVKKEFQVDGYCNLAISSTIYNPSIIVLNARFIGPRKIKVTRTFKPAFTPPTKGERR